MNAIIFLGCLGCLFLSILVYEVFGHYKKSLFSWALGKVYRYQAKYELSKKSRVSGFMLEFAYKHKVLREYKEQCINVQIKAIKKRDTPVFAEGLPRTTVWKVDTQNIETLTYTTTEIKLL